MVVVFFFYGFLGCEYLEGELFFVLELDSFKDFYWRDIDMVCWLWDCVMGLWVFCGLCLVCYLFFLFLGLVFLVLWCVSIVMRFWYFWGLCDYIIEYMFLMIWFGFFIIFGDLWFMELLKRFIEY